MGTAREVFLPYPSNSKTANPPTSPHPHTHTLFPPWLPIFHHWHILYIFLYFLFLSTRMETPLRQGLNFFFFSVFFWLSVSVTQWINVEWMNLVPHSTLSLALHTNFLFSFRSFRVPPYFSTFVLHVARDRSRFCGAWSLYNRGG